ncbi:MAG: tRNA pseudouridine(38-40) synthase TruA [Pseudomonadota bacterium]
MRYAIGVEYDGSHFYGWQTQRQESTVQATVEAALAKVANHDVAVVCAGRTDTGVHGHCQVAHFDSAADRNPRSWVLGANSNLPPSVCIRWLQPVADDFHARFSALARSYRYVVLNRWIRPAIDHGKVTWQRQPLDERAMHAAAQALLGEQDFSAFRSSGCKANHPVRNMQHIAVTRDGDRVVIDVTANAFLYHMVRNIAGSLMAVGTGEHSMGWIAELLAGKDRKAAGVTAPPHGLYFMGVRYPSEFALPATPEAFPPTLGAAGS